MTRYLLHLACIACAPLLAHAGEQPIVTPETVVTATRFSEAVADRPVNVTVITAEQIAGSPATTLPELLTNAGASSSTGVTVMLKVCPVSPFPRPSSTSKPKLSLVVFEPSWT